MFCTFIAYGVLFPAINISSQPCKLKHMKDTHLLLLAVLKHMQSL